jgi:hypothetical protein
VIPSQRRYIFCKGVLNPHHGTACCQGFRASRTFTPTHQARCAPSRQHALQRGHNSDMTAINPQACRIIPFLDCSLFLHPFASQHPDPQTLTRISQKSTTQGTMVAKVVASPTVTTNTIAHTVENPVKNSSSLLLLCE